MLLERDDQLAVLRAALDDAVAGRGRLVLVAGEAGVGKSTLVNAVIGPATVRVLRGVCDGVTTPAPFGALVDMSDELAAVIDTGPRPEMFRRLRSAVSSEPTLLVLEDVHWADEGTLDWLRYLGRRLANMPVLVLATFRSDEVTGRHPLAAVVGSLVTEPPVTRLAVEPLTAEAVAQLVAARGAGIDAAAVHALTGGNPFYVTEVLAAADGAVPVTVRDAVLARTARLTAGARDVLAAAAVLGRPADPLLLSEVAGRGLAEVDECTDRGLLVTDRSGLGFRHELARLAVAQALSPGEVVGLHRSALSALRLRGSADDRWLAHHAAGAGDRDAARAHGTRAAERAARLGAHRQAAAQYRTALQVGGEDAAERARLLVALSHECYLVDEPAESLAARTKALELAELAGDRAAVGAHQRWLSRLSWFLGRNADAERYAERAVAALEPFGDSSELGMAYSNKAQLAMLAGDVDGAQWWGGRALALARRVGDRMVEIHALNNLGSAVLERDDAIEGRTLLTRSLELALAEDAHEHAARAYTNLGSTAALHRRLAEAESSLRAGIAYCLDRDLDSWTLYMRAQLARTLCEGGRLDEAATCAQDVLAQPRLSPITTMVAATAAGQAAARRGEDARAWLERAWQLALGSGEAQRLVGVAAVLAEAAWLTDAKPPVEALDLAWAASSAHPLPWEIGELGYWRALYGLPADPPVALPAPLALMRDRRWAAAADAWRELGCPVWEAHALGRDPGLAAARAARELCTRFSVPAVWTALARDRHTLGLPVPRGPRVSGAGNPAGLTAREFDVLRLLADGLSNRAIADALFLSARTVDHHVASLLRKLGQPSRGRAVSAAIRAGLIESPT